MVQIKGTGFSDIKSSDKKTAKIYYGGPEAEARRKLSEEVKQMMKDFGGSPASDSMPKGRGMGDRFDPTASNYFSPGGGAFQETKVASTDLSGIDFGAKDFAQNFAKGVNTASSEEKKNFFDGQKLADGSYTDTYKSDVRPDYTDSYKDIQNIFQKGEEQRGEVSGLTDTRKDEMRGYLGANTDQEKDDFKRQNITYGTAEDGTPTGTDYFGDKVNYSPSQIKSYIAKDAKEKYQSEVNKKLNKAVSTMESLSQEAADLSYYKSNLDFNEKGEPDPRNKFVLTAPEYRERLKTMGVNESMDKYGTIRSSEDAQEIKDKKAQEALSKQETPNILDKTMNFIGNVTNKVLGIQDAGASQIGPLNVKTVGTESQFSKPTSDIRGSIAKTFEGKTLGINKPTADGGFRSASTVPSGSFGISEAGRTQAAINRGISAATATGIPSGSALAPGSFGISPEGRRQAAMNRAQSAKNFGNRNLGVTSRSIKSSTPVGQAGQFVGSGQGLAQSFNRGGGGGGNTGGTGTTQRSGFTKQGKPQTKAQKMATANIKKHGGTASAAAANKASMRARAKARHASFKKRRAARKKSKK